MQVALELRNSINLRVQSFLINLSMLYNLEFLLCPLMELLLLEVSISQVFGDFNLANNNFYRGGNDRLLVCSVQRNSVEGKRSSHK